MTTVLMGYGVICLPNLFPYIFEIKVNHFLIKSFAYDKLKSVLCGVAANAGICADLCLSCCCAQRPEDQRLIYSGKLLLDHQCLRDLLPKVLCGTQHQLWGLSSTHGLSPVPKVSLITLRSRKSDMSCISCAM